MVDYEVETSVELAAGTQGKEVNLLLLECMQQKIIDGIMSVFQNDETLSSYISSKVDVLFSSMDEIRLEYIFSCSDVSRSEAESFSSSCVKDIEKALNEKGYRIKDISCIATRTGINWGKVVDSEYAVQGRWPKSTYIHLEEPAPSKVIFPASYAEAKAYLERNGPVSLGDCLQWHLPYLADRLPIQDPESEMELLDELWKHIKSMFQKDHELTKYLAILDAERPQYLADALHLAVSQDEYEWLGRTPEEYGKRVLEQDGLKKESIGAISAFTDFDAIGRTRMCGSRIQQTEFGLIRRLREPFLVCQGENALIAHCIDGLTEYAAELLQRDVEKGTAELPFLRDLIDLLWCYWGLDDENLGTCEEFLAVFDRKMLEAEQAQRQWNPSLEQVNGVVQGLYTHSADLISGQGFEEAAEPVEQYKRLIRETTAFWNYHSPLPDKLCAQLDVKLQEQRDAEMRIGMGGIG